MDVKNLAVGAAKDFGEDGAMTHAAAVAFYTALSFAPLVLLLVTIGGMIGGETQSQLVQLFQQQVGPQAADVAESVTSQAQEQQASGGAAWQWVVSIGVLLFSASAVFAQLQRSLNDIWEVRAAPGRGVWGWVQKRLLSMGMIFAILFILLVALVVSSILDSLVPGGAAANRVASFLVSLAVFVLLFAAIYKFLPDVRIAWRDVWIGAGITALLFALGKLAISLYLERGSVGESYGAAAGSLIALLVWVFYSCVIFFFGAEVTQQVVRQSGRRIEPAPHAERVLRTTAGPRPA